MTRDVAAERRDIDATVPDRRSCSALPGRDEEVRGRRSTEVERGRRLVGRSPGRVRRPGPRGFAKGLIALGLAPGEFVNLIGSNDPLYSISDFGVLHAGGVPVSLYNTLAPEQIEYIVNHSEAKYVDLREPRLPRADPQDPERAPERPQGHHVAGRGRVRGQRLDRLVRRRSSSRAEQQRRRPSSRALEGGRARTTSSTLIYTSGHDRAHRRASWSRTATSCWTLESLPPGHAARARAQSQISYLPMAHIAERMVGHYSPLQDRLDRALLSGRASRSARTSPPSGRTGSSPSRGSGRSSTRACRTRSHDNPDDQKQGGRGSVRRARRSRRSSS